MITIHTFIVMLGIIFCSFFCELLYQLMRFAHRAKALSLIHMFHALSIAAITLILFFLFNGAFIAVPGAQSITMFFVVLIGIHIWAKSGYGPHMHIKTSLRKSGYYIYKSIPLTIGTLLQWVLESSDRWMLARLGTMHDVGIYSAAYLFNGFFYSLVVLPWTGAYVPYILQKYAENKRSIASIERTHRRFMWISMTVLIVLLIMGMTIAKPFVFLVLPSAYHNAFDLIAPMVFGRIIYFGAQFNLCLIQFYKKTGIIFLSLLIAAAINVVLNYILIPLYGIYAAAAVSIVSFSIYFIVTWYCNKRITDTIEFSDKL